MLELDLPVYEVVIYWVLDQLADLVFDVGHAHHVFEGDVGSC